MCCFIVFVGVGVLMNVLKLLLGGVMILNILLFDCVFVSVCVFLCMLLLCVFVLLVCVFLCVVVVVLCVLWSCVC